MPTALAALLLLAAAPAPVPAPAAGPLAELPYTPGLDPAAMDRAVDPCVDFYAFSCGGWNGRNPIPPDQARWDVYRKLADEAQRYLWGMLDEAARKPDAQRTPEERKVGDYFAACMDEGAVDRRGALPIAGELAAVKRLRSRAELAELVGRLHAAGAEGLFGFGSQQSFEDSEQVVAVALAGGLGLPDRDLYLAEDARSAETRRVYQDHVERMLRLLGDKPRAAAEQARSVLRIETALARASLTRVEKRDPKKIWHRTTREKLRRLMPAFRWEAYWKAVGAPPAAWLNVTEPAFFQALDRLLVREELPAWRAYLRWQVVQSRAPSLSRALVEEDFAFQGAHLNGAKELQPRWKRCVGWADRDLGEAVGKVFVERLFPASAKQDAERMVKNVRAAMAERLAEVDWMGGDTRQAALEKLRVMKDKIGYPERWRDYGSLQVVRDDFAGNVVRAARFELRRQLDKIGKPVDRSEWSMTPPTVNAYYDSSMNDMNFPAAVLLPPLWDPKMDLAPGYGNTGSTVGHELIHGFDDEGRQFDARGNLKDWWTADDAREFEKRAACVVEQYAQYPVIDDIKINSKLTLGEDLADLAGTILAWNAWKTATRGQALERRDDLSPEQRFFVGLAQWACGDARPENLRLKAITDPHSPPRWRINGVVANVPEFARAFSCRAGQPMVREKPCHVW
jgi:putative endopeptidase